MKAVRGILVVALVAFAGRAAADAPAPFPKFKGKTQQEWVAEFEKLRDDPKAKRIAFLRQFGDYGPDVNELASWVDFYFLKAFEWEVRVAAADALGKIGGPDFSKSVPALEKALTDESWEVRRAAARALGRLGAGASGATRSLIDALGDQNWAVVREAAAALGKVRPDAKVAVPALRKALQAREWEVVTAATGSLAVVLLDNTSDGQAAADKYARDREWFVREAVADSLGSSGSPAKAVPLLVRLAQDREWNVRAAALRSLVKVGGNPAVVIPELVRGLSDPDQTVRLAAAQGLAPFGEAARDALPGLQKLVADPDGDVRKAAAAALKAIEPVEKAP